MEIFISVKEIKKQVICKDFEFSWYRFKINKYGFSSSLAFKLGS